VVKMGKAITGQTSLRHRIKRCDRLLSNPQLSSRPIFAVKAKLITQQGLGDEALGVVRRRAAHAA
jgi:hypothetical protein